MKPTPSEEGAPGLIDDLRPEDPGARAMRGTASSEDGNHCRNDIPFVLEENLHCMFVRDIMSPPVMVGDETPLGEVAHTMLRRRVGSVVVVDAEGAARGIITERDFVEHGELPYSQHGSPTILRLSLVSKDAATAYADARASPAHRIMRPFEATLGPDDPVEKALDHMVHRQKRHLVVLDGAKVIGIVSHHEFLQLAARPPRRTLELV